MLGEVGRKVGAVNQNTLVKEKSTELGESVLTCKECFCWLPGKKGYRCILSGKTRLGAMTACQFVKSRRALVGLVKGGFAPD